jgi:sugar phosphate isomerase/epimerase
MVLATSLRLGHPAEADREAFLACVPWAEAMGVPWLRVFDGLGAAAGNSLSLAAETLSWWRRLRLEKGWKADIIVETHDGLVSAGAIDRFCSLDPGVRLLWDAHATWRATGVAPHALWPGIARHVSHIHVKDSVGRPCGAFPYTYVLPGQGDFPMAPLLQALARDGYSHAVSLEWERHWHPGLPPLEDALAAAAESGWW